MSKVSFKTHVLLKNIIGKDLITDDNIAMLELVKNSFDAGSNIVDVRFDNVLTNTDGNNTTRTYSTSRILICDLGCGMGYNDILNHWLNIAYSEKIKDPRLNGRQQAGNKGIGRFSCDRLGKFLTLYSKRENDKCYKLSIDWQVFEQEDDVNSDIHDIQFDMQPVGIEEVLELTEWKTFEHGTVLNIELLREKWERNKLLSLKRELEKFINPNQIYSANPFRIFLRADEFLDTDSGLNVGDPNRINGEVFNKIYDKLDFRTTSITASIDGEGAHLVTTMKDRGREIFKLIEKNPYLHLRNVKMSVYYLNPYAKRFFNAKSGYNSTEFGSIFLFINGFRVPPYGDEGDDWLGIEKRKAGGYKRYLSTREVVGRIEIEDQRENFYIITNRAGVVKNAAFEELTREGLPWGFFYKGFRRLERFVVEGIKWDKTGGIQSEAGKDGEKYQQDDLSRDRQILSVIRNIIDVNDSVIEKLDINEGLVNEIIEKETIKSRESLETIVRTLKEVSDNLTLEDIDKYRANIGNREDELNALRIVLNKLMPENERYQALVFAQRQIDSAKAKLDARQVEIEREKNARLLAEAAAEEAKRELELEREKNTYLLTSSRTLSEDAKGMIHNIKIIANSLHSLISLQYKKLKAGLLTNEELLNKLSQMLFQTDKALKISKLITRANFKADSEDRVVNIVAYIKQYLGIYCEIMENTNVEIISNIGELKYERMVSVLDIAVIIDNLISNSQKAKATKVEFDVQIRNNQFILTVSDNGLGLDDRFLSIPDSIFELGVTSTDGSGIGLYTVKKSLEEIGGTIRFAGNGNILKGASFILIIP